MRVIDPLIHSVFKLSEMTSLFQSRLLLFASVHAITFQWAFPPPSTTSLKGNPIDETSSENPFCKETLSSKAVHFPRFQSRHLLRGSSSRRNSAVLNDMSKSLVADQVDVKRVDTAATSLTGHPSCTIETAGLPRFRSSWVWFIVLI